MPEQATDHYASAEHSLALSRNEGEPEWAALHALRAQVHATLALVKATEANNVVTTYNVTP